MLRGVVRYARLHGPWEFYITPGDFEQALPDMKQWGGSGIIARIETPKIAQAIFGSGLPTIVLDISQNIPIDVPSSACFSEIASDSHGAARLAADHLVALGLKHFAFIGEASRAWSKNREDGFRQRLNEVGYEPYVYRPPRRKRDRIWPREELFLVEWLCTLPRPVGIMACNDDRGRQVLDACRSAGLIIPLDAAVIGVDNDELLCELSSPPLSSVALNAETGGFRAASLLDQMMRNHLQRPQRLIVEPLHVVQRQSTEASLVADPDIAMALRFIETHAAEPINVDDIVDQLNVSRRIFEIRFRELVGRTPHQELRRARLVRAQRLLLETDLPIANIANAAGFCSPAHLAQTFRQDVGRTPTQYRRDHRT